jgi:hypothetical protein
MQSVIEPSWVREFKEMLGIENEPLPSLLSDKEKAIARDCLRQESKGSYQRICCLTSLCDSQKSSRFDFEAGCDIKIVASGSGTHLLNLLYQKDCGEPVVSFYVENNALHCVSGEIPFETRKRLLEVAKEEIEAAA